MADRFEVLDPTGIPEWDERLACHPQATIFHTAAWARVLFETYGYVPCYFTAVEERRLAALLPFMEIGSWLTGTRGGSLPFTDECTPFLPDGMTFYEAVCEVISWAESRQWRTIEFRGRGRGMGEIPAYAEYLTHELDLTPGDRALFSGYRSNVQRNIRKAEKSGITVASDSTSGGVKEFYRLNCLTRREHGLPPQPPRFFENLRLHVLEKGLGTVVLAHHKGRAVAGAVFLHFAGKAIYKYGASDRRCQEMRPNNLVFMEGIRELCGKGVRTLSFGRTDLHHEGLRQFKLSWGAVERTLQYVKYDVPSKSYLSSKNPRATIPWESMMSRLPLPLLQLIGRVAYRHVG